MDECRTAFLLLKGFWLLCRNETKQGFISGQLKNPSLMRNIIGLVARA
jgi:hypothetical protein